MSDPHQKPDSESPRLDFSPFDPQANLDALCEIVKAIRNMSWTYAGDIDRSVKKIGQMLYAGRCVVCVSADGGEILAYEYVEPRVVPVKNYLLSPSGQKLLSICLEQSADSIAMKSICDESDVESALVEPATYVFPLRAQNRGRHLAKPGLLLLQEPHGLTRWNQRFLNSVVVVAEYLAMVIECERLQMLIEVDKTDGKD